MIKVGDKVKLIDRFYEHEAFRSEPRIRRKSIASLRGINFDVSYINKASRASGTCKIAWSIPIELLEKVEELPKPGDLFKVIGKGTNYHHFELGEIVEFIKDETSMGMYLLRGYSKSRNEVCNQVLYRSDIKPYTKHRYTDEQISEAQRIIGEIVAEFTAFSSMFFADPINSETKLYYCPAGREYVDITAHCSPADEFNVTIGRMVALCRATGYKLPEWL